LRICKSANKPVAVRYWYSAWRRVRAAKRTKHKPVTMVTMRAGHLAVEWVSSGGIMQQKPWRFGGPGGTGQMR